MTKKKTKERKVKMDERQTSGGRSSRGDGTSDSWVKASCRPNATASTC